MNTKISPMLQLRFFSSALIFSLVLSFFPGPMIPASRAAPLEEAPIQGEPVTDLQTRLAKVVTERKAAGLPAPTVTFNTETSTPFGTSGSMLLRPQVVDSQTIKTVSKTTIFFDGPQDAGYETWPPIKIEGNLGSEADSFTTGDLTELIRTGIDKQDPEFSRHATFGKESRQYTIIETFEQDPSSGPPTGSPFSAFENPMLVDPVLGPTPASTEEDILMGFGFHGPNLKYSIEKKLESCFWFFGRHCVEWAYLKAGFEFNWEASLRLPAHVNLSEKAGVSGTYTSQFTPLDWSEVRADLEPGLFHIRNALARYDRTGDLFAPVLKLKQRLESPLERLRERTQVGRS